MKKTFSLAVFTIFAGCVVNDDRNATERVVESAQAMISTDVSATFLLDSMITTMTTSEMPSAWYQTSTNTKTLINVEWSMPKTACQPDAQGTLNGADGTLLPVQTTGGEVVGYSWSAKHALAKMANHWHNDVDCTGLKTVIGCSEPRTVSYTLSVDGECLTAGGTCVATGSVVLPAMYDGDVAATNCPDDGSDDNDVCDYSLGACISACHVECAEENGGSDCIQCCECDCKALNHSLDNDCPEPQDSCDERCFRATP